jgi:hypothetical protein
LRRVTICVSVSIEVSISACHSIDSSRETGVRFPDRELCCSFTFFWNHEYTPYSTRHDGVHFSELSFSLWAYQLKKKAERLELVKREGKGKRVREV